MTDPDFASFGEPNRSRPEGYRLTHPRTEPATGSTNGLTGFDPGRGSLGRPDVAVGWTPADPAPEWATGASPSVAPVAEPPGGNGDRAYGESESLMSAPDSVAIRPDIGMTISDSVSARRDAGTSSTASGPHPHRGPADSEFSPFGGPAATEPADFTTTVPNTPNASPPTTEFGAPTPPKPADPVRDSASGIESKPPAQAPGLPRRTPGLPQQFTDSDESDHIHEQAAANLPNSQFDSPLPPRRKPGGLTNGSAFASADTGHLTDNSLLATAEPESASTAEPPSAAPESSTRTTRSTGEPSETPSPGRTPPAAEATTALPAVEPAARPRATSAFTTPDTADTASSTAPPPPRSRLSRKAAERAAEEATAQAAETAPPPEPSDETISRTTESTLPATRRTKPPARTEQRRIPPQEDPSAGVDVHLIMHLLMASHTLESLADKAEAGDVSLAEFIRAARRTRTAAVDLVSAWFGGADQMRQFAEALLAASDST